jgi:HlyD family secretion protein
VSSGSVLADVTDSSQKNLSVVLTFLDAISLAVNGLTPSSNLSQTTISGYKTDILTARSNINGAISNVASAKEKLRSAESTLSLFEKNLALDKAGATDEDLMAEEARVKSAEANVANYENQLAKTVIRAPFSGVVTLQDGKVGQIVTPGTIVTAISGTELIIEAFVPEIDIAQVAVGNKADVSLDTYGSGVLFPAEVFSVDPAETMTEGVSTYKIKLRFQKPDARIKSGMTANIDATTVHKDKVLTVPARALISSSGKKMLQVLSGKKVIDTEVQIGARGLNGTVEIVSGVSVGDLVVLPAKK